MSEIVTKILSSENLIFEENEIYLEIKKGFIFAGSYFAEESRKMLGDLIGKTTPALILFNIYIPEDQRRQGICRSIIAALEKRCTEDKMVFVVGPFISDENDMSILADFLERRGYDKIMPFGAVYTGNLKKTN